MSNLIPPPHIGKTLVGTGEAIALDASVVRNLAALVDSTLREALRFAEADETARAASLYAMGVQDVLQYLVTGAPSPQLADLLELEV